MLYLFGLGLRDGDIPVRGIQVLEEADTAFAELYTNSIDYDLAALERRTGTDIELLDRSAVENEDRILDAAAGEEVVFMVSGDPLAATTHQDLLFRAQERGIGTEVVHAPSILTAVAQTGLSLYKFGRTTTLTVQNGEVPGSVFDAIETNQEAGLHTLVLVDPSLEVPGPMQFLAEHVDDEILLCSRLGTPEQELSMASPAELEILHGKRPAAVVVPGELSENERERLDHV